MHNGLISIERLDRIAVITLNRPDRMNSFNEPMWQALAAVTIELREQLPRALVLTGTGKAFSAGFDVNPDNPQVANMIDAVKNHDREAAIRLITAIRGTVDDFTSLPVPIIAAINGLAYGGGAELAMRCDMRIADPSSVISFSEVKLGLMPDWGGGVALSRLLGTAKAADLILTGRKISADAAFALGLVNSVSKPGGALDDSIELAAMISKNGPRAVRCALAVVRGCYDPAYAFALNFESEKAADLVASGECIHGITAFLSKKEPEFPDE
jgi:enoyl-CoA hydratase/carnithine racemase